MCRETIFISILCAATFSGCGGGQYESVQERLSPDGEYIATHYRAQGGGAAGWTATNLEVRRADAPLGTGTKLFVRHRTVHFKVMDFRWAGARTLRVEWPVLPSCRDQYSNLGQVDDVQISYEQITELPIWVRQEVTSQNGGHVATAYVRQDCDRRRTQFVELRRSGISMGEGTELIHDILVQSVPKVELSWRGDTTLNVTYNYSKYNYASGYRGTNSEGYWTRHEVDGVQIQYEARRKTR